MRTILDWAIRYFVRQYESLEPLSEQQMRGAVSTMKLGSATSPGRS